MRFPVVLAFRNTFERFADSNSLAIKFSQQQFGDLHDALCEQFQIHRLATHHSKRVIAYHGVDTAPSIGYGHTRFFLIRSYGLGRAAFGSGMRTMTQKITLTI